MTRKYRPRSGLNLKYELSPRQTASQPKSGFVRNLLVPLWRRSYQLDMTVVPDQQPDRPDPEKLATIGGECCPSNGSASSCCGGASIDAAPLSVAELSAHSIATAVGEIPVVATELTLMDRIGAWKVRWGIGRMRFTIPPGLYAVGKPNDQSPVLVTANYKMTKT